jgi:cobalt/nickel transport system permease protein
LHGGALVSGYHRGNFFERNIKGLRFAMERALYAENSAASGGLLQGIDPRVKLAGLVALIVAAALSSRLWTLVAILALGTVLAALSLISLRTLFARVWAGAFLFSGLIAVPALFMTPGPVALDFPNWGLAITAPGLRTAAFLVLRVEASATLALLLIFTTPWMHVLKALRVFRAPVLVVVILGMTCRYILLLLEMAHELFEARKSRTVGVLDRADRRRMAVSAAGVLLNRSFQLSGDVYLAMQSRGFRGEVYLLDDFRMQPRDWAAACGFAALTAAAIWAGRR